MKHKSLRGSRNFERAMAKMLENINNYTLLLTIIQPYF
ncbi:hypothetical protein N499_1338 [Wolbachia pipientis wVitA]|nr:hypothetical protein N499_1338 [Wolbachia pipientis wVitA]